LVKTKATGQFTDHSKMGIIIEIRRRYFDGEPKVVYVVTLNGQRQRWYTEMLVKL
jgi:hypothetical protein